MMERTQRSRCGRMLPKSNRGVPSFYGNPQGTMLLPVRQPRMGVKAKPLVTHGWRLCCVSR